MVEAAEGASKPTGEAANAVADAEHLIFTIRAGTGEVLNIEKVDKTGSRGEFSEEDCRRIAGEGEVNEIEAALDAGYEAGIHEAVGDEDLLERLIMLRLLVSRRPSRGLGALRRSTLRKLLLLRLIRRHESHNGHNGKGRSTG